MDLLKLVTLAFMTSSPNLSKTRDHAPTWHLSSGSNSSRRLEMTQANKWIRNITKKFHVRTLFKIGVMWDWRVVNVTLCITCNVIPYLVHSAGRPKSDIDSSRWGQSKASRSCVYMPRIACEQCHGFSALAKRRNGYETVGQTYEPKNNGALASWNAGIGWPKDLPEVHLHNGFLLKPLPDVLFQAGCLALEIWTSSRLVPEL